MSIAVGLMQHHMGLASDENKELRIDHAGMSSHHAMTLLSKTAFSVN